MKLNYKSSKTIGIIIGIVLFIAIIGGITYAIFNWRSTNTNISVNTKCFDIQGNSSYTVNGSDMLLFDENDILDTTNNTITYKNGMIYYPFNITRGSQCNTNVYYEIIVNVTTLSEDYRNGSLKYKIIDDMSSYTSEKIVNPLDEDLEYIYEGTITDTGSNQIYFKLIDKNTNIIPAVVFYLDGDLVPEDASNLTFTASVEVAGNQANMGSTAADYIEFLYNTAGKKTATVNNITYNLAPFVGLMNDRHASMSTDINGGDIRYYGSNPNNYVWLGDTYTSTYTFTSNGSNITRNAGDKKLWRVIGAFDGRLKLISNDPISEKELVWDTSANTNGGNSGVGINQWGPSGNYEGSDLMRLLNPGYESESVNNSLYWNKGTGTVYTEHSNQTTSNVSFINTGLSQNEKNMIDTATWYLGTNIFSETMCSPQTSDMLYVNNQYFAERQSSTLGKMCSSENFCNDTVVRTSTWEGKVALIYPSDYGYATDLSVCSNTLKEYDSPSCSDNNWIVEFYSHWTISPLAANSRAYCIFIVSYSKRIEGISACSHMTARSVVFLKNGVTITGGIGSEIDPYVLSLS